MIILKFFFSVNSKNAAGPFFQPNACYTVGREGGGHSRKRKLSFDPPPLPMSLSSTHTHTHLYACYRVCQGFG